MAPAAGTAVRDIALRTNAAGTTSVNAIDFSKVITATDKDGDTVIGAAAGKFTVAVQDDVPIANPGAIPVTASVEEDGMAGAATDDLSTGNKNASGDLNTDDETSGAAGSLTGLFSAGADEPLTTGLKTSLVAGDLPTLWSKGEAVTYAVASGVLTASAGTAGVGEGVRTVFTLTVNDDGSWAFDLKDQLDHVAPAAGTAVENIALRTNAAGTTSVNAIDFSKVITATDKDGDTVIGAAAGKFTVAVQDDVPIANPGAIPVTASVEEDGMAGAATDDLSTGNKDASGDLNTDDETSGAAGSLTGLFSAGADEPLITGLKTTLVADDLPTLWSKGEAVTYAVASGVLTASAGTAGVGEGVRTVFTLTVNDDGSWAFDLKDQLDHVAPAAGTAVENIALRTNAAGTTSVNAIDFSKVITATDKDGDTVIGAAAGNVHRRGAG